MTGGVYAIPIQGRDNNYPHPHVIILEITGTKECLLIPAFSSEGVELELYLTAAETLGYRRDEISVEMDNAQFVTFIGGMTGKKACWLLERHRRISVRELLTAKKIGDMNPAGLSLIAKGILQLAQAKSELFSPALLKKIRKLVVSGSGAAGADAGE
jgi:hypothetical protein